MQYELIEYPHDTLRNETEPVVDFGDSLLYLLEEMKRIMLEHNGVGIAAPQVNARLSCFLAREDDKIYTFVNPVITDFSDDFVSYEEGCLSVPRVYAEVERPSELCIIAQDPKGKDFKFETEGFLARVIQHEMDHLYGILFFDYLPKGKQRRLLKKYTELQSQGSGSDKA